MCFFGKRATRSYLHSPSMRHHASLLVHSRRWLDHSVIFCNILKRKIKLCPLFVLSYPFYLMISSYWVLGLLIMPVGLVMVKFLLRFLSSGAAITLLLFLPDWRQTSWVFGVAQKKFIVTQFSCFFTNRDLVKSMDINGGAEMQGSL